MLFIIISIIFKYLIYKTFIFQYFIVYNEQIHLSITVLRYEKHKNARLR